MATHFIVYGRTYCHLCHDLVAGLQQLQTRCSFSFDVVDIDRDPQLEERFGALIPVVEHNGKIVCNYFLDEAAITSVLAA